MRTSTTQLQEKFVNSAPYSEKKTLRT